MMFKDPFQPGETPYEILGLQPDASPAEVQASLPRFMGDRKNLPRLAVAQQALRKLKTAADRAQVDIWLYNVDTASAEFVPAPSDLPNVTSCPVNELYSDLSTGEHYKINFDDLKHYDLPELDS
jgi:hypothetical protein